MEGTTRGRRRWCGLGLAVAVAACDAAPAPARYRVTVLEPPASTAFAAPLAMARDGSIVGYAGGDAWDPAAVPVRIGPGGEASVLGAPGGVAWAAGAGLVVGEHAGRPVAWTGAGDGRVALDVPAARAGGLAIAVGDDGQIVGAVGDPDGEVPTRPCVWAGLDAPAVELAVLDPSLPIGMARAVTPDGAVVGEVVGPAIGGVGFVAVRWDAAGAAATPLPLLHQQRSGFPRAVNAAGEIAGFAERLGHQLVAFVIRGEAIEELPALPGGPALAVAQAIGDDGVVVGLALDAGWLPRAVLWRDGEIIDLQARALDDAEEPRLIAGVGIDAAGRIAVEAAVRDADGGWVARIGWLDPVD